MGWLRRGGVQMMYNYLKFTAEGPLLGEEQSVTGKMLLQQGQNSLGLARRATGCRCRRGQLLVRRRQRSCCCCCSCEDRS